jgi:hypothetical protein
MRAYRRLHIRLPKRHRDKVALLLRGGIQPVRVVLRALALTQLHDGKAVAEVASIALSSAVYNAANQLTSWGRGPRVRPRQLCHRAATSRPDQEHLLRTYRPLGITMLAEKVETQEEFALSGRGWRREHPRFRPT